MERSLRKAAEPRDELFRARRHLIHGARAGLSTLSAHRREHGRHFFARVQVGKRRARHGHAEELAERRPAVRDFEDEQTVLRDRTLHFPEWRLNTATM